MPAHDPTGMFRLSMVGDLRYAEDLPVVEGHDYILRVGEQFPLMVLGCCLYGYRIHSQSVTKKDPLRRNRLAQQVIDRMCDRRGEPRRPPRRPQSNAGATAWDADNDLVSHFTASVADQVIAGRRLDALRTGLASWRLSPNSTYYAKPLVYALTPRIVMRWYQSAKRRRRAHRLRQVPPAMPKRPATA
jgi:hypothetical protein